MPIRGSLIRLSKALLSSTQAVFKFAHPALWVFLFPHQILSASWARTSPTLLTTVIAQHPANSTAHSGSQIYLERICWHPQSVLISQGGFLVLLSIVCVYERGRMNFFQITQVSPEMDLPPIPWGLSPLPTLCPLVSPQAPPHPSTGLPV